MLRFLKTIFLFCRECCSDVREALKQLKCVVQFTPVAVRMDSLLSPTDQMCSNKRNEWKSKVIDCVLDSLDERTFTCTEGVWSKLEYFVEIRKYIL